MLPVNTMLLGVSSPLPVKKRANRQHLTSSKTLSPRKITAKGNKYVQGTRFQYVPKDEAGHYVVRIIDKATDKIIREIPSKKQQELYENIQEAIGLLFDKKI